MIGRVVVMEPADYQAWLSGKDPGGGVTTVAQAPQSTGEGLFARYGCASCHRDQPGALGPALAGLFGSDVRLAGGESVVADEAYLRESIVNPRAKLVEGYKPLMPTFQGQVDEESLLQLIEYIKSL
jgi:cytochrome c oxidase subunit 2